MKVLLDAGILRMVGFSSRQQAFVCLNVLLLHASELSSGALITAEPGRLRVRLH
jgi:predicted nuclease of predicted toxin-antitoxin system